jgi:hypothetical protein
MALVNILQAIPTLFLTRAASCGTSVLAIAPLKAAVEALHQLQDLQGHLIPRHGDDRERPIRDRRGFRKWTYRCYRLLQVVCTVIRR